MPVSTAIVMITPLVGCWRPRAERAVTPCWTLVVGGFVGTMIIIRPAVTRLQLTLLLPPACGQQRLVPGAGPVLLYGTEDPMTATVHRWVGALLPAGVPPFVRTQTLELTLWPAPVDGFDGHQRHFPFILLISAPAATPYARLDAQIGFTCWVLRIAVCHVPDRWSLAGIALRPCGCGCAWLTVRGAVCECPVGENSVYGPAFSAHPDNRSRGCSGRRWACLSARRHCGRAHRFEPRPGLPPGRQAAGRPGCARLAA